MIKTVVFDFLLLDRRVSVIHNYLLQNKISEVREGLASYVYPSV